ncbi:NAD(P)-dependent oxidoreductase [Anaerocolumna cellulosilytica]|uniref:dTDP-4-dehydrorhamnose reductase n=1 Tax=Anaerocolumna cellulosilytica TaxID=433286 RepID=A0A6S6QPL3_9FIRM|nr:dTDP-4-dehydrorhamnose reductase [Anaerocolumna cellulosilytica]MBB5194370.1 dTDP-4-dehydrorhamnose reductase [Anaerocolumna cellulosilytica]BCJ93313.1 NAD(P)-dependent oxidoreductase [Anaerocolumna cellulosilytica]
MERRIIITGANGQLGHAINKIIGDKADITILNTGSGEPTAYCPIKLDITNSVAVMNLVQDLKPEIIINCAAHTAVDLCESEQERAYRINALGPKNLAVAAEAMESKLIHISTDYVFDGEGQKPYTEEDDTNPQSVYGKTKLEGENFVRTLCEKHFIIRTAWLYGEGRNFVKTMLRISENNPEIRVVYDQVGCPTSAVELAKAIEFLMDTNAYGTYHGVCKGVASWYDFAVEIFRQAGVGVHVTPITTAEYKTPAKRPMYSVLDTKKLEEAGYSFLPWKEALKAYMMGT